MVARELLGCRLVHRLGSDRRIVVRLVEVEAYLGDGSDAASHAHRGPTPRNRTMFGPAGHLYAYRSYGIHTCVNVVCAEPGRAAAVLLRAAEPVEGIESMRRARGLDEDAPLGQLARGPGRLAQALSLGLEHDGQNLLKGVLTLHPPAKDTPAVAIEQGPRVGISQAADLPYRYFERDSAWVSGFRAGKVRGPRRTRR
jgi:DNA-3-methyladenine glycosylase